MKTTREELEDFVNDAFICDIPLQRRVEILQSEGYEIPEELLFGQE